MKDYIAQQLKANKAVFNDLLQDEPEEMYLWKPSPEKWCLLEIVCHLYDEEREDFRARLLHTLETPEDEMTPIDPEGWVKTRDYIHQDYGQKLTDFFEEREKSVNWLGALESDNWDNTYHHPTLGAISAGDFLCSWLAHDYLHFRQITRIKYQYLQFMSDRSVAYAGKW